MPSFEVVIEQVVEPRIILFRIESDLASFVV